MRIRFTLSFVIAFLSLLFLIQEFHDWAHVLTGQWICSCLGTKTFDNWTLCDHCDASGNILVLAWLAGPAVNYLLLWIAWSLMSRRNSAEKRSTGFCLLFAANPFVNILAAFGGGGDITYSMRLLFQHQDGGNRHIVSIISLIIVLLLTVTPIMKAVNLVKGNKEKLMLIPAFLLLPNFIKLFFVTWGLNKILNDGFFQEEIFPGTPLLVIMWLILVAICFSIYYKSLSSFIKKKERKTALRI